MKSVVIDLPQAIEAARAIAAAEKIDNIVEHRAGDLQTADLGQKNDVVLLANILHLDVEDSLRRLDEIFPKVDSFGASGDYGEAATYRSDANQSYEQEHARIFQPLAALHELLRRTGVGVYHAVGALG